MQLPTLAAVATALLVLLGGVAGVVTADTDDTVPTTDADRAERLQTYLGLTDERMDELTELVERMRADGATPTEVLDAVERQLLEWDVPQERIDRLQRFLHERHHDRRHDGFAGHFADALGLSAEERTGLHELVHTMRADSATRAETLAAVHAQLADWGYTDDEVAAAALQARLECLGERLGLSDEETDELVAGAEALRTDGATRAELRAYVHEMLTEWGSLDGDADNGRQVGPGGERPVGPPTDGRIGPAADRPMGPPTDRGIGPDAGRPAGPHTHGGNGPLAA